MKYFLVKFACYDWEEPKFYLLDEHKHDDWCECEPQEGYKCFEEIWHGPLEQIILKERFFENTVIVRSP